MANFDWYEIPGDGTDVPECVAVVNDHIFV